VSTVAGLDVSLQSTGVAVIWPGGDVQLRRVRSKGKEDATLADRRMRLRDLAVDIVCAVPAEADLVVIEQPAFSRQTGHMHDRSGLWWLVVDHLTEAGHLVAEVSPTARARYATGRGNAGKDEVLAAVVRRYPTADVSQNDVADALILAAMGAAHLGHPLATLPLTHTAALDGVTWPTTGAAA
jgi:crossover junction endodeoxyribonuclease RuvC